jgi:hypothetical protein
MNQTQSFCPVCLEVLPARVLDTDRGAVMEKSCAEHGPFSAVLSPDVDLYERLSRGEGKVSGPWTPNVGTDRGCPHHCGLCPEHEQHTCVAILEITSRCDLECPVCLASSFPRGRDLEREVIERALRGLLASQGQVASLQISGGEPTQHEDLIEIIRYAASLGFHKVEMYSNGVALAADPHLAGRLRDAGLTCLYLQMDGLESEVSLCLRGRDLVREKARAMENCTKADLQVVLSATVVPGLNDHALWELIRFGVEEKLTGVNFQPLTLSGRVPSHMARGSERFTVAHFLRGIEEQSGGRILARDLVPIPCPDQRCALLSYALIHRGELIPLTRLLGEDALLEQTAGLNDWETLIRQTAWAAPGSGCSGMSGELPKEIGELLSSSDFFSIGFHGMMDAYDFDVARVRRCCVHELTPEGKLIPFCLYNIKYRQTRTEPPEMGAWERS